MNPRYLTLALLACMPQALPAQEGAGEGDEQALLALLDEETAIATRTRMNADYVPGMVTVLHGDDLESRGARTVWEALALVPGMETAIEKTGRRKVLVRGLGNTWASGNIKILLNDVSMNSAELGLAEPVFNIPIEQVDRIEVIRGPGSAIYGEYAYMGVINIVTRGDDNRVFAFGGSFNTRGAGATLNFTSPGSPLQASFNLAGWSSSGADVKVDQDALYTWGVPEYSNAPGPANEEVEAGTAVFKLGYQRFSLTAQWTQDGIGDHFGINYYLPPDPDRIVERTRHRTIDMRQELPLTPNLTAGIQLGWKEVERRRAGLYVIPSVVIPDPDTYLSSDYVESGKSLGADLTYRGWDRHTLLLAASSSRVRVDDNRTWFDPSSSAGVIAVPVGTERAISAITLQDEYRHSDLFTLTTGLRYDEYSDAGVTSSPRIAGVWRINERHIVKAQYAEAFRPPTLYEIAAAEYWNQPTLDPARISTSEVGYIFKGEQAETKITAFYSRLNDLLMFVKNLSTTAAFGSEGATAQGLELEQSWRASREWSLSGNLSYVDTRDDETGDPFPGTAPWLANASALYQSGRFAGALQLHYVDGYSRESEDSRSTLAGYTTLDVTATLNHFFARRLTWRLGIKNLLDTEVRYPAPVLNLGGDAFAPSYANDYPQAGRSWWTELSYQF